MKHNSDNKNSNDMKEKIQKILDRNFTRGDNAKALNELLILFNVSGSFPDYDDAEIFLQEEKDIYNHPYLSNRNNDNSYDVADLLVEFALKYAKQ